MENTYKRIQDLVGKENEDAVQSIFLILSTTEGLSIEKAISVYNTAKKAEHNMIEKISILKSHIKYVVVDVEKEIVDKLMSEDIYLILNDVKKPERDKEIFKQCFFLDRSFKDVGKDYNITGERVRVIYHKFSMDFAKHIKDLLMSDKMINKKRMNNLRRDKQ